MTKLPRYQGSSIWVFSTANSSYLPRLVALDRSLGPQSENFHKKYLNLDEAPWPAEWERLLDGQVVQLNSVLSSNPRIPLALKNRTLVEKFFTLGPQFLTSQLSLATEGDWIVYCDADIKFFTPIQQVLAPFESKSVVLARHNHFWWNRARLKKYGEYNVGLVAFRNTADGRKALEYWAERCIEWCYDKVEGGKYADQKYLEDIAELGIAVAVDDRRGSNLAPWNSPNRKVLRGGSGTYFLGQIPILYFHMQGLKRSDSGWELGHLPYLNIAGRGLKREIYLPYLSELEDVIGRMGANAPQAGKAERSTAGGLIKQAQNALRKLLRQTIPFEQIEELKNRDSN